MFFVLKGRDCFPSYTLLNLEMLVEENYTLVADKMLKVYVISDTCKLSACSISRREKPKNSLD